MKPIRRSRRLTTPWIALLVLALGSLPSCRRAPETPPPATPTPVTSAPEVSLNQLELPLSNPEIGITLDAVPPGLVATYNGEHWVELTDTHNPQLRYTFVSDPEYATGMGVADISDFEMAVLAREDGRFDGGGEIDTALGTATWVSGSFSEDGELIDQVMVSVPHPSGTGRLIVSSIGPQGVAGARDRLGVIVELLSDVS